MQVNCYVFNGSMSIHTVFRHFPWTVWKGGIHLAFFLVLLFQVPSLRAQSTELEDLLADLPMVCGDVALNIGDLAKQYFEAGQLDSLHFLATYWESYCGPTEPVTRLFNLISLAGGTFNDSPVNDSLMNYVTAYEDRLEITSTKNIAAVYSKIYMEELGNIPLNGAYDHFTREMADKLLTEMPYETDEYLLTLLYSNNSSLFSQMIRTLPYSRGHFGILYGEKKKEVERKRERLDFHILKIWVPFFVETKKPEKDKPVLRAPGVYARMKKRYLDCMTVSQRLSALIIRYRKTNRIREVGVLADFWVKTCGISEPLYRLQNLLAIEKGELTDFSLDKRFFYFAQWFEFAINPEVGYPPDWYYYYRIRSDEWEIVLSDEFDRELLDWADELLAKQQKGSLGYLVSLFYSGRIDEFYGRFQSDSAGYGSLSTEYEKVVNKIDKIWQTSISLSVGSWMPTGNLGIVGPKPTIGYRVGFDNKLQRVDFGFDLAIDNRSRNPYDVVHDGQLQTTEHFQYYNVGAEYSFALVQSKAGQIQLFSGIGLSSAHALRTDTENDIRPKILRSLNVNTGISFRVFNRKGSLAALQFRYNLVNFRNKGGTDLGGDFFSVNLLVDLLKSNQRYDSKRALRLQGF